MRSFVIGVAALALLSAARASAAETFPARQVTIVSPYQAGGTSDIVARILAQELGERWSPAPLVENRPGANGALGIGAVARSPADGHVWIATASSGLTVNPLLQRTISYDVERDLAPITRTGAVANVLVVHPGVPARTVGEFVALAREKPGAVTYASQGAGSNGHLNGELFRQLTGVSLTHVPYKGSAPAVTDLLGGHVSAMFDNLPSVLEAIRAGALRALAVTTATRSELLPDVPTMAEAGLGAFETSAWFAVLVPRHTPEPVRSDIERAVTGALASPRVRDKLAAQGVTVIGKGADDLSAAIRADTATWRLVITRAGIAPE